MPPRTPSSGFAPVRICVVCGGAGVGLDFRSTSNGRGLGSCSDGRNAFNEYHDLGDYLASASRGQLGCQLDLVVVSYQSIGPGGTSMIIHRGFRVIRRIILGQYTRLMLQMGGAKIGRNVRFLGGIYARRPDKITIEDNCLLDRDIRLVCEHEAGSLLIEAGVQINDNVYIDFTGDTVIGAGSLISSEAVLFSHSHGYDPRSKPVMHEKRIGKNTWIGMRSIILETCTEIGDGAIVGAGSVATKSIHAQNIVAGNPARPIRQMSEED